MDIPYPEIAGILVCLILSGFFSGSETALTSLSHIKVDQIIDNHKSWGRVLAHWKNHQNGILTTILIANNLANVTASAIATQLAGRYFTSNAIPIAIGIMTFLVLFVGEITPKTVAKAYAESVALPLMTIVLAFHFVLFPLSWIISVSISGMVRLVGGRTTAQDAVTEEDLEFMVNLSKKDGLIDSDKQSMLNAIFEFGATVTREIMVPRTEMVALPVDSPYKKVLEIALSSGFTRIPIYEDSRDKILGVFHTKDLITPPDDEHVDNFLSSYIRQPMFVPESKKISEVLKIFQKDRQHLAIVVDEFGGTEGIVTMEDIIEELLGDIHDEFDIAQDRIIELPDQALLADARVDIEEVESSLQIEFPNDRDYESLGGYLIKIAGEVPAQGWQHVFKAHAFKIVEADANRIIRVHIQKSGGQENNGTPQGDSKAEPGENASAAGE